MFIPLKRRVSGLCLLFVATATVAQAQQLATSFEQLRVLAKPGDTVTLTDTSGEKVTGTIIDLSSSSLGLVVGRTRRDLAEADVKTISQQRHGNLGTGAKWGFAAGACVGAVGMLATAGYDEAGWMLVLAAAGLYGGIGSGVGVGISSMIRRQHVIYAGPGISSAKLTVSPLVTSERKGVLMSLGF